MVIPTYLVYLSDLDNLGTYAYLLTQSMTQSNPPNHLFYQKSSRSSMQLLLDIHKSHFSVEFLKE